MKVLVDFTQIPSTRTGVGVYAEHLVRELAGLFEPEDRLFVLMQDDENVLPAGLACDSRVRFLTIPARLFRNRVALLAYEQIGLPLLLCRLRIDIVHSLHYTFPLISPAARVVTVHDLTFFLWPKMHTLGRRLCFRPFILAALRLAEAVTFVSASTQSDAERLRKNAGQLRCVTPLGVGDDAFEPMSGQSVRVILEQLGLHRRFLLFVGTIEPRKNVHLLIEAFDALAEEFPDVDLALAGKTGWHSELFERTLAGCVCRERIRRLGYVTDEQRRALMSGAAALIYPSLYEGFGLPVLEAMAAGVPVVTSSVSSLPEVTGSAALLVNPASVKEIVAAMRSALGDGELARKLVRAGKERARMFTWRRTAATTYEVYRAVYRAR